MPHPDKIRVAVLYGGRSGEHEVSLLSAANIIRYLDRLQFEVIPIGIDKQGVWFLGDHENLLTESNTLKLLSEKERMLFKPTAIGKQLQHAQPNMLSLKHSERIFDVVFPAIHGVLCEDGTVQGLLELADVPYVGCGVLSSAIGMDKDVSKRLIRDAGINVASYITFKQGDWQQDPTYWCETVTQKLRYPVFVKPANMGSSVGIEKIKQKQDLTAAINRAFQYDTKVVIEQAINAIELEVAVLESLHYGNEPIVSVVGEVKPSHEFYSYAAKYLDEKGAELIIPTSISEKLQNKAQQIAKKIFTALECESMARVDLFLDKDSNEIYFNEVNTIPGFTKISMYPKLLDASGINYSDLLTHLVKLAMNRHTRKSKLCYEYAGG